MEGPGSSHRSHGFTFLRKVGGLGVLIGLAGVAAASPEAPSDFEEIVLHLEELIVTSQKRPEDPRDVPVSVTSVSGELVSGYLAGGGDVRSLSARVPNLHIESSFGRSFPRLYLRGYGNTDFDLNTSQPVSFVMDGVVQEHVMLKGFPLFDLERIEVLRGPQGTLFGRNTPAGIFKVESAPPSFETLTDVRLSGGTLETGEATVVVNRPLGPEWAIRLSSLYQTRDDWVDNHVAGAPRAELGGFGHWAGRLQLMYESDGPFRARLNVHGSGLDGTARIFHANAIQSGTNRLRPGFDRDRVFHDGDNVQDVDTGGGSARLVWELASWELTSITGFESADAYSRGDIDGGFGSASFPPSGPGFIPFASETAAALTDHRQWTEEVRLAREGWGRFDLLLGAFWFDEDSTIESISYDSLRGGVRDGLAVQRQRTRSWSVFGSAVAALGERTSLRVGLRFSDEEKEFSAERVLSRVGPLSPRTANPSDSDLSWDVSLMQELTEGINAYGRVATGFRAPSIQGRVLFGDEISVADSETILSWEVGFKASALRDRLRLNGAAFAYTVDDQQLTAVGGGANFNTLLNAEETHGRGFELDLQALLARGLELNAGIGYADTEIDSPGLAVEACGSGCTVLDPPGSVSGTVIIDGNDLPQAPRWTANLSLSWKRPAGPGDFVTLIDAFYRDEVQFFLYESVEFQGDVQFELGLKAGYAWRDGDQEVALVGRNVTDETAIVGGVDFINLTGFVSDPAYWGLQYRGRF